MADNFKPEIVFPHLTLKFYIANEHADDKNSKIFRTKIVIICTCVYMT